MERLYQVFFLLPDGKRRDTSFVYLNVYDAGGRFLYQLAYDPQKQGLIYSQTEFYE